MIWRIKVTFLIAQLFLAKFGLAIPVYNGGNEVQCLNSIKDVRDRAVKCISPSIKVPISNVETAQYPMRYWLYIPNNTLLPKNGKFKLLIAIHGTNNDCSLVDQQKYVDSSDSKSGVWQGLWYLRISADDVESSEVSNRAAKAGYAILSPAFCSSFSNERNANALADIIREIQTNLSEIVDVSNAVIWGHSQGGEFVQAFLRYHGNKVKKAAVLASGSYSHAREWTPGLFNLTNVLVGVGSSDCSCGNTPLFDREKACFELGSGLNPPLLNNPILNVNWNDQCVAGEDNELDSKWRRQMEAQSFVCCDLARKCNIEEDILRFTPPPEGLTKWSPSNSHFKCSEFRNSNGTLLDKYKCGNNFSFPDPSTLPHCENFRYRWVSNEFKEWGHLGSKTYNGAVDFLLYEPDDLKYDSDSDPILNGRVPLIEAISGIAF